ncbi:MAG: hypothetical protein P1R58_00155 [bacterium]|nr:hypothetical protein [bacterium]
MKLVKIGFAVLLSLALLYVARTNSRGQPKFYSHTDNGITFEMTSVPKVFEKGLAKISVKVTGLADSNVTPVIRTTSFGQDATTKLHEYRQAPLILEDSAQSIYRAELTAGLKGGRQYYYFEVRDNVGGRRATFTDEEAKPFILKYIGHVPTLVLVSHIFFIFASVFMITLASIESFLIFRGTGDLAKGMKLFFWATLFMFIGGYPIGFAMNWFAFDGFWEGVPFGTDATDNKTQLIFVYLLFMLASGFRSLTASKLGRNVFSPKALGLFGMGAFLVQLAVNLIPHSIQFEPTATYIACYGFIGMMALIYLTGLISSRGKPT